MSEVEKHIKLCDDFFKNGNGSMIILNGANGSGKTRLANEMIKRDNDIIYVDSQKVENGEPIIDDSFELVRQKVIEILMETGKYDEEELLLLPIEDNDYENIFKIVYEASKVKKGQTIIYDCADFRIINDIHIWYNIVELINLILDDKDGRCIFMSRNICRRNALGTFRFKYYELNIDGTYISH